MHWEFVIPGYLLAFGGLGTYTLWMLRRSRSVAQHVPADKRRFLD